LFSSSDTTDLVRRREKEERGNQKQWYPNKEPDDRENRYAAYDEKGSDCEQDSPDDQINHPCGYAICIGHGLTSLQ
jgi:hypothetical protein